MHNEPRASELFHYTKRFCHLWKILDGGFWPRYSVEDFGWIYGTELSLAIPMVCFCDIPVASNQTHKEDYGDFAISIHKGEVDGSNFISDSCLNPVWYLTENSWILEHLQSHTAPPKSRPNYIDLHDNLIPLLPYLKQTPGSQRADSFLLVKAFEDELEWRYVPKSWNDKPEFNRLTKGHEEGKMITDNSPIGYFAQEAAHAHTGKSKLPLPPKYISKIYVTEERYLNQLKRDFPHVKDSIEIWDSSDAVRNECEEKDCLCKTAH